MAQMAERSARELIVEGVAIVLSILLAFAIDAWWDERHERAEEKEVLESLYIEFEANRDAVTATISFHDRAIQSIASLRAMAQNEILALQPKAVEAIIGFMGSPRTFDAVRGSVDALISSGKLGILQDRQLREALTTFINIIDDTVEDTNFLGQSSITVWNEMAKSGGPWRTTSIGLTAEDCASPRPHKNCYANDALSFLPVATPQDLLRLRDNAVLMGYVYNEKINAAYYASEIRETEIQIESVLKLLSKNLKLNIE
jgi:hypothetical protein